MYVVSPPSSSDSNYSHFVNTVLNQPAIEGVTVKTSWIDAETGTPGTGRAVRWERIHANSIHFDGAYLDWSNIDSQNVGWFSAQSGSKKMNVILAGIDSAAAGNCLIDNSCINGTTPHYVSTSSWAAHTASGNEDLINANKDGCSNYLGLMSRR